MENKKFGGKIITTLTMFIILTSIVAAFGINDPIELLGKSDISLSLGENKEIFYYTELASNDGDSVIVTIEKGAEVLSLVGPNIIPVSPNTKKQIYFNLKAPSNAKIGDSYPITVVFKPNAQGTGTIGVGQSIIKTFTVTIGEKAKETPAQNVASLNSNSINTTLVSIVIVVLIILGLIIYYILKRKK